MLAWKIISCEGLNPPLHFKSYNVAARHWTPLNIYLAAADRLPSPGWEANKVSCLMYIIFIGSSINSPAHPAAGR